MDQNLAVSHRRVLTAIMAAARRTRPVRGIDIKDYLGAFYGNVDEQDLQARDPAHLAAGALSLLRFARKRRASALVRVFNPSIDADGYTSRHTIVEMVNDDMPFLVDSIGLVLAQRGLALHFLAHPIFAVTRRRDGVIAGIVQRQDETDTGRAKLESFQHLEIDRLVDAAQLRSLATQIERSLHDVRIAYADWAAMRAIARAAAEEIEHVMPARDAAEADEARALLNWMENKHFTFLGYREYRLRSRNGKQSLLPVEGSGLGILRNRSVHTSGTGRVAARDIRRQARAVDWVLVTKANSISTVHRRGYLDYVGVKQFDRSGRLLGERRFLGLWTSAAYSANPRDIPVLRRKVARVIEHFALAPDSHDGKALQHILENFPRDELFQAGIGELVRLVTGVFGLQERPRVRLLVRRDPFRRFYSCLVFVPRDKYNTQVRQRVERVVREGFAATALESQVQIAESNLARVYIVARTLPSVETRVNLDQLERKIEIAVRSWGDNFKDALLIRYGEAQALDLYARYANAFPAAYTEDFDATVATRDVGFLESLESQPDTLHLDIYRPEPRRADKFFLKIFRKQDAIAISDVLPMLENMGLKVIAERPYELELAPGRRAWIQDLEVELRAQAVTRLDRLEPEIKSAFTAVWSGRIDSDPFNQLTLSAGLAWRTIAVFRAYCRYLLQVGLPFSQGYMAQVLVDHAQTSRLLAEMFAARFQPKMSAAARRTAPKRLEGRIRTALEAVTSSDEDRILRAFWNAMCATVRTNVYQPAAAAGGASAGVDPAHAVEKDYMSFKIESQKLPELPLPRPLFEVFVFSTRMEGIHLRMGLVARGGIRWSDRREDFRTEVLGLMKAQNVKNTLIVPVGAKGGFVVKRMPAGDRDAQQREVIACYRVLIQGLLDITDNIVDDGLVPPPNVVRHDADDPYLVVAADKGTATFSDIANALSDRYGFWLGDAFASGGSAGYDHKKMAITARGGWECVQRHFREMNIDVERQEFSVAGIGDMSGDVFGNGMLQSRHIRLVAAFNHQHIFLDPNPAVAASFKERRRLFNLPRSTWEDYSTRLISKGGGVFSRSAKTLTLSKEAQTLLELPAAATPNEVVKAILKSPVDLLWNGGIGTYVKASHESSSDVGDRGNDAVRVDGRNLRCKVIGEGGNLGLSQLGRVEYARCGGRLNTDFIDNSAGVNCSDVEVNLKILLNAAVRARKLTRPRRDRLLVQMTDEVAALVLRNNYLQSQAISTLQLRSTDRMSEHAFVIRALERSGDLNRTLEFLPSEEEIAERRKAGEGFTRPELALTLSYSKIWLYRALIHSDVPEDPYLSAELLRYFPAAVQRRFGERVKRHRLRREIIATAITNSLINRMGFVFPVRAREDTGAAPAAIARAYTIAREVFKARELWAQIEGMDNQVPAKVQYATMYQIARLLRHMSYWYLTNHADRLDIKLAVERFAPRVAELFRDLVDVLGPSERAQYELQRAQLVEQGAPEVLAGRLAALEAMHAALDLVEAADAARVPILFAARAYFELGERLGIAWLKQQIESLAVDGHWQAVARGSLRDNLFALQRKLAAAALAQQGKHAMDRLDRWMAKHSLEIEYLKRLLVDMRSNTNPDFATLSVALQSVRRLTGET